MCPLHYKNIKFSNNPLDYKVLVNKNNRLLQSFIPDDLVLINKNYSNENKYLRKEAAESFEKLSQTAKNLGYRIVVVSAFRDYDYQKNLFNHYVSEKGLDYALSCSAKPGHSEHQTGASNPRRQAGCLQKSAWYASGHADDD